MKILAIALVIMALLIIPTATQAQTNCAALHTVQSGQNLFRIGLIYNVTWDRIANANGLAFPNSISPGQVLCIPFAQFGTGGPVTTPTPTNESPFERTATITIDEVTDQINVRGSDFPAETRYDIYIASNSSDFSGDVVLTGTTDAEGNINVTFDIPQLNNASVQYVTVVGSFGNWARTFFVQ